MASIDAKHNVCLIESSNAQYLNRFERKYSKFYKCANFGQKCVFTTNNRTKYRHHLNQHSKVYCFYCQRVNRFEDESVMEYYCGDMFEDMIEHMIVLHGHQRYQCNHCPYRAISETHVYLHHISFHYHIWKEKINSMAAIQDSNACVSSSVCKIIKCKQISFGPPVHYSIWFQLLMPTIRKKFSGYYCLFCEFNDDVIENVYIHFAYCHSDKEICIWNNFDDTSQYVFHNQIDDSDVNVFKDLPEFIKIESKGIPGLEKDFKPPIKSNNRRSKQRIFSSSTRRTEILQCTRRYYNKNITESSLSNISDGNENITESSPNSNHSTTQFSSAPTFRASKVNSAKRVRTQTATTVNRPLPPPISLEFNNQISNKNTTQNPNISPNIKTPLPVTPNKKVQNRAKILKRVKDRQNLLALNKEKDEDITDKIHIPQRSPKARFENRNFYEPVALGKSAPVSYTERNVFRCLICNVDNLRLNKIDQHLMQCHNTNSSFRCGLCPAGKNFIDNKFKIKDHIKLEHPNREEKIEKFIVPSFQLEAIILTSAKNVIRPPQESCSYVVRKSGTAKKKTAPRGALMQQIKESTFLGPLRNDVTQRRLNREPDKENDDSDEEPTPVPIKEKRVLPRSNVAKKSTSNARRNVTYLSDNDQLSDASKLPVIKDEAKPNISELIKEEAKPNTSELIKFKQENISQYFCIFCSDMELKILDTKKEAIEHYKAHLNLGYYCGICNDLITSYDELNSHYASSHRNVREITQREHNPEIMRNWILQFLDNQMTASELVFFETKANAKSIKIECPICVKASIISKLKPKKFSSLWKVKHHLYEHLSWMSHICQICAANGESTIFPNDPYLLMKHLATQHRDKIENIYFHFRGHKPYYVMSSLQLDIIEDNYKNIREHSSDILDALLTQLLKQIEIKYEIQMKKKYGIEKEISIIVNPLPTIKSEPIDDTYYESNNEQCMPNDVKVKTENDMNLENDSDNDSIICLDIESESENEDRDALHRRLYSDANAGTALTNSNATVKTEIEENECMIID